MWSINSYCYPSFSFTSLNFKAILQAKSAFENTAGYCRHSSEVNFHSLFSVLCIAHVDFCTPHRVHWHCNCLPSSLRLFFKLFDFLFGFVFFCCYFRHALSTFFAWLLLFFWRLFLYLETFFVVYLYWDFL